MVNENDNEDHSGDDGDDHLLRPVFQAQGLVSLSLSYISEQV